MNWPTVTANACAFFGAFVAVLVVLGLLLVPVAERLEMKRDLAHRRIFDEGVQHARQRIAEDGWWFSEDPATCDAIRELANGGPVDSVREKWRRARADEKCATPALKPAGTSRRFTASDQKRRGSRSPSAPSAPRRPDR